MEAALREELKQKRRQAFSGCFDRGLPARGVARESCMAGAATLDVVIPTTADEIRAREETELRETQARLDWQAGR